jgi:hypothetical protein
MSDVELLTFRVIMVVSTVLPRFSRLVWKIGVVKTIQGEKRH